MAYDELTRLTESRYAVVVAHPDDEVIWFGSVLAGAGKVIVCYGDLALRPGLGERRRRALADHPLGTIHFLDLPEGGFLDASDWANPLPADAGVELRDAGTRARYEQNFATLTARLEPLLADVDGAFTHNPWGEYGHEDHVQVHRAVDLVLSRHGRKPLFVPSFHAPKSEPLRAILSGFTPAREYRAATNSTLSEEIKQLYQRHDCWTWEADWQAPAEDSFLALSPAAALRRHPLDKGQGDVFQLLMTEDGGVPATLPDWLQRNIASVGRAYPQLAHRVLGGKDARAVIAANFEPGVLEAFDRLRPHAFKADLARYCLLYLWGGIYLDVGIELLRPIHLPAGKGLRCFRDMASTSQTTWGVSNGILLSEPGRAEFKLAVDLIVENCRTRHYGINALCPTGPNLLGRALALAGDAEAYDCGGSLVGGRPGIERPCFVDLAGEAVATVQKPSGAPGLVGWNDYTEIWRRRQAYGEAEMAWSFSDQAIRCDERMRTWHGIVVRGDRDGHQIFGPYVPLAAGRYRVTLLFAQRAVPGRVLIDVVSDGASVTHARAQFNGQALGDRGALSIDLQLRQACRDVEIRLAAAEGFSGIYLGMRLSGADVLAEDEA